MFLVGSVEGLFILYLFPILSNPVSEKTHLSAYCYSCLIWWRLLPSVSCVGTFLRGLMLFGYINVPRVRLCFSVVMK